MNPTEDKEIFDLPCYRLLNHLHIQCGDGDRIDCPWKPDSDSKSFVVNGPLWTYHAGAGDDQGGNVYQLALKFAKDKKSAVELLYKAAGKTPPSEARRLVANYDYIDADGSLVLQVLRYHPKSFSQRRPDGNGGWVWSVKDIAKPLYNLPEVITSENVVVVEGEKDVETLRALGICGTTSVGGAGKWKAEYADVLTSKRVAVIPDNDDPGRSHAQDVVNSLIGKAADVRLVELPGVQKKGDVTDWLEAGHTADELIALIKSATPVSQPLPSIATVTTEDPVLSAPAATPTASVPKPTNRPPTLKAITAPDLCAKDFPPPKWMVDGLIPQGLVVFFGKEKIGKSFMCIMLGVEVARGGKAFGCVPVAKRGVLYLALEDSGRRLQERINNYLQDGEVPANLHLVTSTPDIRTLNTGVIEQIEEQLQLHPDIELIIIDTLQKVMGTGSMARDAYQNSYDLVGRLHTYVTAKDICALVIHHEKKGESGDEFERISGSRGLTAVSDAQIRLERARFQNQDGILSVTGRDVEEKQYSMAWDSDLCRWTLQGEAIDICKTKQRQQILDILNELGGTATPAVVNGALMERGIRKSPSAVQYLLMMMAGDGSVRKIAKGLYAAVPHSEPGQCTAVDATAPTPLRTLWDDVEPSDGATTPPQDTTTSTHTQHNSGDTSEELEFGPLFPPTPDDPPPPLFPADPQTTAASRYGQHTISPTETRQPRRTQWTETK